jgi:hypothetical protein
LYRWISGGLVAAVVLGMCVGCGGGGDDSSSDITKAQFLKQADAVCADFRNQRQAVVEEEYGPKQRQGPSGSGQAAFKKFEAEMFELAEAVLNEKVIPLLHDQHEQLASLGAPAADAEKVETMLDNLDKAIGEIEGEDIRAVLTGNNFDAFESEAKKYGLKCKVI